MPKIWKVVNGQLDHHGIQAVNMAAARKEVLRQNPNSSPGLLLLESGVSKAKDGAVFYHNGFRDLQNLVNNLKGISCTIITDEIISFREALKQWDAAIIKEQPSLRFCGRIGNKMDFINPSNFVILALILLVISFIAQALGSISAMGFVTGAIVATYLAPPFLLLFGGYKLYQDFKKFRAYRDKLLEYSFDKVAHEALKNDGNTMVAYLLVSPARLLKWVGDHKGQAAVVGIGLFALAVALAFTIGFFVGGTSGPFGFMENIFGALGQTLAQWFNTVSSMSLDILAATIFIVAVMATTDLVRRGVRLLYLLSKPTSDDQDRLVEEGGAKSIELDRPKTNTSWNQEDAAKTAPIDANQKNQKFSDDENDIVYKAVFVVTTCQDKLNQGCCGSKPPSLGQA